MTDVAIYREMCNHEMYTHEMHNIVRLPDWINTRGPAVFYKVGVKLCTANQPQPFCYTPP